MDVQSSTPTPVPQIQSPAHPFAALSADEIVIAAGLIRNLWPSSTNIQFKTLTLLEPPKAQTLPYLQAEHAIGQLPYLERKAWVNYYLRNTNKFHEAVVNLSRNVVERNVRLGPNFHAAADGPEILAIERIALEDPMVKTEIEKLKLPEGTVIISDPWLYGSDGVDDDERMYQCFLYMRDPANIKEADSNHYALPLQISPVVSTESMSVVRVDILPTGVDSTIKPVQRYQPRPPKEYLPEYQKLRTDLKPLNVVQPQGASFKVTEQPGTSIIEWQKWYMRVGFNLREGMVIYDVRYDGRPLFYRLSLSDMNIPYADPRHPFHKKSAFDLGDVGAGIMANDLKLGCDCLGSIYYLSGVLSTDKGKPLNMPNSICIHEQDAGIGWKHTNYRTGRAALVRQRELVVQSIITVANYEYILAFMFNQAAEMHYEVRATGILSTQPIDDGVEVSFGNKVHPGVLAAHHQHIFSLRVDPYLDGSSANRLVYSEAHPMPVDPIYNPHGNGYVATETPIATSGGYDLAPQHNRIFKIQNAASRNPVNGRAAGYKIMAPPFQPMLSHPTSFNARRAEFADHNIYVVAHRDGELYSGGMYTNQSRGGTGVASWAARADDILDRDLVVFVQFGLNHLARVEDWPVMPCEVLRVGFKPVDFFDRNPALDVPPSEQSFNKSVSLNRASEEEATRHAQPGLEATVGQAGKVCCGSKL